MEKQISQYACGKERAKKYQKKKKKKIVRLKSVNIIMNKIFFQL